MLSQATKKATQQGDLANALLLKGPPRSTNAPAAQVGLLARPSLTSVHNVLGHR